MYVSIGEAAIMMGVCIQTLRQWEVSGYLTPKFRTSGGHRRYLLSDIHIKTNTSNQNNINKTIAYARVSSNDQKQDLLRQQQVLENYCKTNKYNYDLISDLGSGLNFNKKGLHKLINLIINKQINT